jgi:ADP-ribosylglycohydrolase
MDEIDRYHGALLGLAVGDALGTAVEFRRPGTFEPVTGIAGGGPFGLKPGQWTDDTSMALCLADSLVERRGFDPVDQMSRYVRWWQHGFMSSNGECFDIGNTVRSALHHFMDTGEPYSGSTRSDTAGNGSLMRLAPVPLFFAKHPVEAIKRSGESSCTTHGAATAVDACRYYGGLIVGAVQGEPKEALLSSRYSPVEGYWQEHPLAPEIDEIAAGSFKRRQPPEIAGTGYVVRSLEAALWAFHGSTSFSDGCLQAVNLGDDADTTGAIYGQLAGAYYGYQSIPGRWRHVICQRPLIESMADKLYRQRQ